MVDRRQQYKPRSLLSSTRDHPDGKKTWKNELIKRCLVRARADRDNRLRELRGIRQTTTGSASKRVQLEQQVKSFMTEEFESPVMQRYTRNLTLDESDKYDIEQAILEELLIEEEKLVEEYEMMMQAETDLLAAELENVALHGDRETVLCPVCKKRDVLQNGSVFVCGCGGLRVDTALDQMSMSQFREKLGTTMQAHQTCAGEVATCAPIFRMVASQGDLSFLICECVSCGFHGVVV